MPDKRLKYHLDYIGLLQSEMRLKDWTIRLSDHPPDDSRHNAEVACTYGRKDAQIYMSARLLDDDCATIRQTIVHELIHLHFEAMRVMAESLLDDDHAKTFRLLLEYGVDAVADVIAPYMPLPKDQNESAD